MTGAPERALVLAPHPDDEAIGCGGTLRGWADQGASIHVVFLTSGEAGGHGAPADETAQRREREAGRAAEILGVASTAFWRFPDGRLRAGRDLARRLSEALDEHDPTVLLAPHPREEHDDHRATARLVDRIRAERPAGMPEILLYEVWTAIERIDAIVDISAHLDAKRLAIRAYESQCDVLRFDEAALGLARWRGEMHSWPGGPYAEAFARPRGGAA